MFLKQCVFTLGRTLDGQLCI
uniref:Uncharacterized protein n=1 Tax=Anguilla anguilla TaxID=7936 RepID=A0A0E9UEC0_ANGAN